VEPALRNGRLLSQLRPARGRSSQRHRRSRDDKARDHRSRTSWPGLVCLLIEGALRELGGPKRLLGNHVVLDFGNGSYAALAHLRRGSVLVRPGDHVNAGEQLAECGKFW